MGTVKVLDREYGDKPLNWDKGKPDEVEVAKREFDFLVQEKGYSAFKVGRGGKAGERISAFDPLLEEVVLIPQRQGG